MLGTKFVKAYCKKTGQYFGLEVKKYGSEWKVVNMDFLSEEKGRVLASEVEQSKFYTNKNLLACSRCNSREVGGCSCGPKKQGVTCKKGMKYNFDCVYCKELEIDYSLPSAADISGYQNKSVTFQGKEVKIVTFSNVTWTKFDNIQEHQHSFFEFPFEPKVHVIANKEDIEFHGYNISQMDEGVYYVIGENDDFEIECNVNTSTIRPHPGGCFYVSFGLISADIYLEGGKFYLDGKEVASVGSKFSMKLSLTEKGKYQIFIDGKLVGSSYKRVTAPTKITFGFKHDAHYCKELSHAYMKNIKMKQGVAKVQ